MLVAKVARRDNRVEDAVFSPPLPACAPRTQSPTQPQTFPSPATASEAFAVLTNARLTPYDSSHRADDALGVLVTRADATPPPTPPPMPRTPLSPKSREDDARPSKACPRAALLHDTQAYLWALATPALIVRPISSPLAPMRPPSMSSLCGAPRLIADIPSPPVRRRSPVEACPRLQSSPSATLNQSLAPAENDSVRDDGELTVTPDDGRVGGSINPPSLTASAPRQLRHARGVHKRLCGWGGAANTGHHEVERKTTPVPFIPISEPKPELDDEAALLGGKRKR
ncbi:hypothetical protein K438DRAFT_1985958 [Mycena galopus ATCC 62051]|nr:hypothetical protein K438DRAFT_1985958 [Mycena galopus ATCC 62051]